MNRKLIHKPLEANSKIAIISPAGMVKASDLEATLELIIDKGYEPVMGQYALGEFDNGYKYSGTVEERLMDLNWALNDPSIDAVWTTRGGFGCQHLLRGIKLTQFRKKPKWYIGYSDNTAIQSYLTRKNCSSISGQTIKTSSFKVDPRSYELIFDILKGQTPTYTVDSNALNKEGSVNGELVGGNLALVYALMGSPYSFDFKDKILFLEEIGEDYYALDRMITSLELAGVFKRIKGLVIGGMINMGNPEKNSQYESSFDPFSYEIISQRLQNYNFPTLYGFPNGHIYENRPLIIGGRVQLTVDRSCILAFL